ncbi:MAG: hypothetical protein U5J83_07330 [Bryobacterales bacterium]|nr:hypothetical protein [Bryobacterales bacterium]
MQPVRVALSGLTSVVWKLRPQFSSTPDVETAEKSIPAGEEVPRMAAGPGVALVGGILARLGVSCTARMEVAVDPPGALLRRIAEQVGPALHPVWRPAPDGQTTLLSVSSWKDGDCIYPSPLSASDFCFDDLPLPEAANRVVKIWCHPAQGLGGSKAREEAFAKRMSAASDRGASQILLLGKPLVERDCGEPWQAWLRPLLDHTNVLCAQAGHLLETLDAPAAQRLSEAGRLKDLTSWLTGRILHQMSGYLLECGAGIVLIGLGDHGVYLRSNPDSSRVAFVRKFAPDDHVAAHLANWTERDMLIPPFEAEIANRYSAPDAMCAGFVAAFLRGLSPGDAIRMAAAVEAFAAETEDPIGSVEAWDVVQARVEGGWAQGHCRIDLSGWSEDS